MREHLQKWYREWLAEHEDTNLIYATRSDGKPSLPQVHFVRDVLYWLMVQDMPYDKVPKTDIGAGYPEADRGFVIGEHHSKSVRLPVYLLEREDLGIKFVLRYNFHDWNVSVVSELPVTTDLRGFVTDFSDHEKEKFKGQPYQKGGYWNYLFYQGFPDEYCLPPYAVDQCRFSTAMVTEHEVFTLVFLIMRDVVRDRKT